MVEQNNYGLKNPLTPEQRALVIAEYEVLKAERDLARAKEKLLTLKIIKTTEYLENN